MTPAEKILWEELWANKLGVQCDLTPVPSPLERGVCFKGRVLAVSTGINPRAIFTKSAQIGIIDICMLLKVCRLIVYKALIFGDGYTQKIWRESTGTKNKKGAVAGRIS